MKKELAEKINKVCDGILAMAGVYSTFSPGTIPAGVSKTGVTVFVGEQVANTANLQAGAALAHALAAFVMPFGVLSKKEFDGLERISKVSSNSMFIGALDKAHFDRQGDTFAATLIKSIGVPTSHALAVVTSLKLYDHWGVMSPTQKSLAITALAIQIHKTDQGGAICDLVIVSGCGMSFTVKNALDMLQLGKNPYPLVQNWDQIYRLLRVYNEKPTNESMLDFASSHNLIGRGITDGAVPGVSKAKIQASGSKPSPQYGVGALATPRGSTPPDGYTTAAEMPGGNVIVPESNSPTAIGALKGSLVGTKAGASGISGDAAGVYAKWNPKDKRASDKGSEGGSALVAGLTALKGSDPYLYSSMIAFLLRYSHGTVNASNPSEYLAALSGIALARLVSGKSEEQADKEGVAVAKSVQSASPADFAKTQVNIRALYATFGISSSADAFQLSNQAYSEGRLNESDLVAVQQIFDTIYDNDAFGELAKLLAGREKGLEIAKLPCKFVNKMANRQEELAAPEGVFPDIRAKNRAKYAQQDNPQEESQEPAQAPEEETAEAEAPATDGGAVSGL